MRHPHPPVPETREGRSQSPGSRGPRFHQRQTKPFSQRRKQQCPGMRVNMIQFLVAGIEHRHQSMPLLRMLFHFVDECLTICRRAPCDQQANTVPVRPEPFKHLQQPSVVFPWLERANGCETRTWLAQEVGNFRPDDRRRQFVVPGRSPSESGPWVAGAIQPKRHSPSDRSRSLVNYRLPRQHTAASVQAIPQKRRRPMGRSTQGGAGESGRKPSTPLCNPVAGPASPQATHRSAMQHHP